MAKVTKLRSGIRGADNGGGAPKKAKTAEVVRRADGTSKAFAPSSIMVSLKEQQAAKFGDPDISTLEQAHRMVIGIPLQSLAFELLMGNDVWPLERMVQLQGLEGSYKSTLLYYIGKLFIDAGGLADINETENKPAYDSAAALLGHDVEKLSCFGHTPCDSVEAAQKRLTWMLNNVKYQFTGYKPSTQVNAEKEEARKAKLQGKLLDARQSKSKVTFPGKIMPVLFGLDSLVGRTSEEISNKIDENGAAGRNHPVEALKNTPYLKKVMADLRGWPFSFVITNHLRVTQVEGRFSEERRKGGGKLVDFGETFEIECRKLQESLSLSAPRKPGQTRIAHTVISLQIRKSSMGMTYNGLQLPIRFWKEKNEAGIMKQHTELCWHEASMDVLDKLEAGMKKLVREIIPYTRLAADRYVCKHFKATEAAPMTATELGAAMYADETIRQGLRDLLGIHRRVLFSPQIESYDVVRNRIREAQLKAVANQE